MDVGSGHRILPPHYGLDHSPGAPAQVAGQVAAAALATRDWLLARQHPAGYWCGELEGDTILESEYILLLAWLRRDDSPIVKKAAEYIRRQQLPGGGWAMYPGGQLDISGSVKAYFALKLAGHDPYSDYMRRARHAIRKAGGADAVNSFTRFYLALLGQISYDRCPAVPPELVLLPNWSPINIYRMSAWSRTIVVPLSIMWAHRPSRKLAPELGIRELFLKDETDWPELRCPGLAEETGPFRWERFFRRTDALVKWLEQRRWRPLRRRALGAAEEWMTSRFAHSDGLGAIFPPIIWSIIALKCLGYDDDSVELKYNFDQLRALTIEERDTARLQPCLSPVWDTTIALRALAGCGLALSSEVDGQWPIASAVDWLLDKEVSRPGDWSQNVAVAPGGWYFEHHNEFYPDVDDTAMALIALREVCAVGNALRGDPSEGGQRSEVRGQQTGNRGHEAGDTSLTPQSAFRNPHLNRLRGVTAASQRALRWMQAMQNRDGGWGAFDKDNDSQFLCRVPFADHNAMIDPSTPDLTARVLEALALWGARPDQPRVQRAIAFLRRTQERDGSWFGRWGVNYIYGTWQVLVGLAAIGVPPDDPLIRRGANWLLSSQQACGGWGESADSYEQPELKGQGPCTPSQTAWALLGLMASHPKPAAIAPMKPSGPGPAIDVHPSAGPSRREGPTSAIDRGIRYLLDTQNPDGSWDEPEFTGTGFPRVFYLRYHYYRIYFPLLALTTYRTHCGVRSAECGLGRDTPVLHSAIRNPNSAI
jgi:squalene-hopene/tetraprenyl-beta-curcumene cyclase